MGLVGLFLSPFSSFFPLLYHRLVEQIKIASFDPRDYRKPFALSPLFPLDVHHDFNGKSKSYSFIFLRRSSAR